MHQDSRGYWYRSKRIGARVTKEYFGQGEHWAALAWLDEHDRQISAETRAFEREQRAEMDALDREAKAACDAVAAVMRATLEAAGYHQHARGAWRRRREKGMVEVLSKAKSMATSEPVKSKSRQLLERANDGDAAAAQEIFALAKDQPLEGQLIDSLANVGQRAQEKIIAVMGDTPLGDTPLHREAFARKIAKLRAELAGPDPSPLELLLIERVVNCWLQVHQVEMLLNVQENPRAVEYFEKRLDKAHKRYLASIKTLAQVRRLQLPSVQVNIGQKQVNIGQMNQ